MILWYRLLVVVFFLGAGSGALAARGESWLIVSVADQELLLVQNGIAVKRYPVSTSKFGVGDQRGSYRTPLGTLEVVQKIGSGAPLGSVFKGRQRTGEVLRPNAPGRDPIVTRILWLKGLQPHNRNAYQRAIYIHGTPEERLIGRPASYGCIRMRSRDVADLYNRVSVGTRLRVTKSGTRNAFRTLATDLRQGRVSG